MFQTKKIAGLLVALASLLFVAACGAPATPAVPTVDANMIYTAAAQTVQAQLTQNAVLTPSPTATTEPTATVTAAIPTANTNLPTMPIPGANTPVVPGITPASPLATLTPMGGGLPGGNTAPKQFQWLANDPPDGTVLEAGTKFDIAWSIKNTGTVTWTKAYTYAYFSGNKYFEKTRYNLPKEVKPGEEITILVDAVTPSKSGSYYTWWKLVNDQGVNIGDMDLRITVVQPGETAVPTAVTVVPTP